MIIYNTDMICLFSVVGVYTCGSNYYNYSPALVFSVICICNFIYIQVHLQVIYHHLSLFYRISFLISFSI